MSLQDFINQPIKPTQVKKCKKCGEVKPITEFRKQGKCFRNECKCCKNEYNKEYRLNNPKYQKNYYKNNKENKRKYNKKYRETNKEIIKENKRKYRKNNKEQIRETNKEYQRNKLKTDQYFKFALNLRNRIRSAFKSQSKNGKTKACEEYGIDFAAIYAHVGERPAENYHLDHIIPLSVFNLDNPEHVRLAHLPENLRWLPGDENCSKNDFVDWSIIKSCHTLFTIALLINLKKV